MMIRSLITAGLLASLLALPATSATAANSDLQGVCAPANMSATPSVDLPDPLHPYCAALREGRKRLSDQPAAALAAFRKAAEVAPRFTDPADRARAEDEARAGLALALEVSGNAAAALHTIQQPSASKPDIIALARGAMLARLGLYTDAAKVLTDIRPLVGECSRMDRAIEPLRKGVPTGYDPLSHSDMSSETFLPSWWWYGCQTRYSSISLPDVRSYHLGFDPGRATWLDTATSRRLLADMVDLIRRNEPGNRKTWRLVGHTDHTCPKAGKDCQAYNTDLSLRRAEAVKSHLVAALRETVPDLAQRILVVGRGMEQPLFDAADRRNRRVDLAVVLAEASTTTADCPWQVTLYDAALPGVKDGERGRLLHPGETAAAGSGSAFTVQLDKALARAGGWTHAYALTEDDRKRITDLMALSGAESATFLASSGTLPGNPKGLFRLNADAARETIWLIVARKPLSSLEDLHSAQGALLSDTATADLPGGQRLSVAAPDEQKLGLSDLLPAASLPDKTGRMCQVTITRP